MSFKHDQKIGQTLSITGNGEFTSDQSFINDYSTGFEQRLQQNLLTNVNVRKTLPGSRTLTMNLPLNFLAEMGSGTGSRFLRISAMQDFTNLRMPANAFSGSFSSQLRPGNSAHKPTCSWSSSDQVTR